MPGSRALSSLRGARPAEAAVSKIASRKALWRDMEIPPSLKNELSQITNSLDLLKAGLVGSGFPFLYVAVSCVR